MSETPWTVSARNLPEHAGNPIHTDAGARAAGFSRALVAGVTVYAYAVHPVVDRWGLDWAASGGGEVRFRSPVFDGDELVLPLTADDEGVDVVVRRQGDDTDLVTLAATPPDPSPPTTAVATGSSAEILPPLVVVLDGRYGADYATRAGDDLTAFADAGVVHPAVWPALANAVTARSLVDGGWVHTRSRVTHRALAPVGTEARVEATVRDRFSRPTGERAVLDVSISVEGRPVADLEHEAIVRLPSSRSR